MSESRLDPIARAERSAAVRDAIRSAANRSGVDFTYLLAQAKSESGLDPTAQAGRSSAAGLYQFIDQSWLGVLKQHGGENGYGWAADRIARVDGRWQVTDASARDAIFALRKDPAASSLMAAAFARDNAAGLSQALGRTASSADLYFAHFLGLKGATRFLKAAGDAPDATAAALFPTEAKANRGIFYRRSGEARSLSQVYALMARKLGAAGDAVEAPVQMAGGDGDAVRLVDLPASSAGATTMLALAGRTGAVNMLRPDPRHAMLAYRLIAASLI